MLLEFPKSLVLNLLPGSQLIKKKVLEMLIATKSASSNFLHQRTNLLQLSLSLFSLLLSLSLWSQFCPLSSNVS